MSKRNRREGFDDKRSVRIADEKETSGQEGVKSEPDECEISRVEKKRS